jgi:hypothetical protein
MTISHNVRIAIFNKSAGASARTATIDHWHNQRNSSAIFFIPATRVRTEGGDRHEVYQKGPKKLTLKKGLCSAISGEKGTLIIMTHGLSQSPSAYRLSLILKLLKIRSNHKKRKTESRAKHRGDIWRLADSVQVGSDASIRALHARPNESGGLLVVLLRVRTTLLRNAFSLSSLSRRERSSSSRSCGTSNEHPRARTTHVERMTHLPRLISLPLNLSLSLDLDPRR